MCAGTRCVFMQDPAGTWGCLSPVAVQQLVSSSACGQLSLSQGLAPALLQVTSVGF